MADLFSQGYALIIGAGGDLSETSTDAQGLASLLKNPERCAYPPEQVKVLADEQANRQGILDAMENLAKQAQPDSTVVFYFSGHGYQVFHEIVGASYWLMPNGYDTKKLKETAIPGNDLVKKLAAIPSQKMLILLDCCHAGGVGEAPGGELAFTKAPLPPETLNLLSRGSGTIVIASSKEDEKSFGGKPYSAFTLALIEALCGVGASKNDGFVRAADLAMHTRQVVPGRTENRQHPILHFENADNFRVAFYAGGEAKPKGLPFPETPQIEPEPGAWRVLNQTTVQAGDIHDINQSNVNLAGRDVVTTTYAGPVFSGPISGQVSVGSGNTMTQVNAQQYEDRSVRVGGSISGSTIVTGDNNTVQVGDFGSKDEFIELLREMQSMLLRSGLSQDEQEEVRDDLKKVEEQAEKDEPNKGLIFKRLEGLSSFLGSAATIAVSAAQLAPMATQALEWAKRLFP